MAYDFDFEQPLIELEEQIASLQCKSHCLSVSEKKALRELERELEQRTIDIYRNLSSWQTVQVARHKDRPYTTDYIGLILDDFFELHGDRKFADDPAIIAGLASLDGNTVMLIGHQKGRDTREKIFRNSGMPHPEGYRKAHRLMQQAEKLSIPVISLIDTSGASITIADEERGQSTSIAENLSLMIQLRTPILAVVIGEGGSGGALAIGVADRILMLEHAIYSVAAPEAAASILYRDTAFAPLTAEAMRISAKELKAIDLIDELIAESPGGAHRNPRQTAEHLKAALIKHIGELQQSPMNVLLERRYQKFRNIGVFNSLS